MGTQDIQEALLVAVLSEASRATFACPASVLLPSPCAMPGVLVTDEETKAQRGKICPWLQSDGVAEVSPLPTPW